MKTVGKWKITDAGLESCLQDLVLVGRVVQGRGGLGSVTAAHYDTFSRKEERRLVQEDVR